MDSLALFTAGEFTRASNPKPWLALFTAGEFPRLADVRSGAPPPSSAQRVGGGSRRPKPELFDLEELAIAILLLDD